MTGFNFPLGMPDGVGYAVKGTGGLDFLDRYDYQGDGIAEFHPGEDWNEAKNGKDYNNDNNDYGDPIYSIGNGTIKYAKFNSAGWGNLVLIEHQTDNGLFWSQYGHMMKLADGIVDGRSIKKGETIGYVGAFPYGSGQNIHLHFEIRKKYREAYEFVYNWSKERVLEYYICPTDFINSHRPVKGSTLTATSTEPNKVDLSWTKSEDVQFQKYEIYRSTVQNGTDDPNQRTLVYKSEDQNLLTAADSQKISGGNTYYYRIFTYFKNGMVAKSEEVDIALKRVIEKITDGDTSTQHFPVIDGGKVFWEDLRAENNGAPKKLYFYDLATKKTDFVNIGIDGTQRPLSPAASGSRVVYYAYDNKGTDRNVYCYDFNTGNAYAITQAAKGQYSPVISDDGIVVWSDLRNGNTNSDLYYLDVKKSEGERPLVSERYNQLAPRIWKSKVVWKDSRVGNRYDLYTKEIGGTIETVLATNTGSDPADIWENWVVWTYNGKLSLMNTETKEIKVIRTSGAGTPRVRDGKIVYEFSEGGGISYIHVYDIATAADLKIDFSLYFNSSPFISGNVLVFDASDKQTPLNFEIYLTYL